MAKFNGSAAAVESFLSGGFVLYEESGKPCVTFLYSRGLDAEAGRDQVQAALAAVVSVKSTLP